MSRMYVIQSWSNAGTYSGEQIGDRLSKSKQLHFTHDGKANTSLYKDKPLKEKPIDETIIPQLATLNKLDDQELRLERAYRSFSIGQEEYEHLSHALKLKRERAFKSYMRAIGEWEAYNAEQNSSFNGENRGVESRSSLPLYKGTTKLFKSILEARNPNYLKIVVKDLLTWGTGCIIVFYTLVVLVSN